MNYNILNSFCQTFHLVSSSPFPLFYDNSPFLLMIGLIIILILMINIFVKNSEFNILNNPILLSNKNPKDKSRNSSIPNKKSKNIQEISEIISEMINFYPWWVAMLSPTCKCSDSMLTAACRIR